MNIKIKKLIMHNFLSYGHAELDLEDKGYCLVSGVNNNPRDNAVSNGSGKSSWGSAICWALTGQTISGLSKNIKNINVDENKCYVTLLFTVDNDSYEITRYANPKSDLTIKVNDKDVSGKGIRESETILAKYLPDLTSQLISSIIILGQGLPCKFSANTPAGRKETLEKLSKSDFMIQDLKNRIAARQSVLATDLRSIEDNLLVLNTTLNSTSLNEQKLNNKVASLSVTKDFDAEINQLNSYITEQENNNKLIQEQIKEKNSTYTTLNEDLSKVKLAEADEKSSENYAFNNFYLSFEAKKASLQAQIRALTAEITKLKNIKDVCPTCGQKLPNVMKPSTEKEEAELLELKHNLEILETKYAENEKVHDEELSKITNSYKIKLSDLQKEISKVNQELATLHNSDTSNQLISFKTKLAATKLEKENHQKNLDEAKEELKKITEEKIKLIEDIENKTKEQTTLNEHIKTVNQLNTLIKRDFRGYLLKDIIDYIDNKAKEYSEVVFGTRDLDFILDGNNINISYANKSFESLSGGEKQRVDLIIQFSIRDMLSKYLGFSSNILILDEIFDNLDAKATSNILNLITTKLNDIESMFIISHHADELGIPYDTQLIVIKNEEGISDIKLG